MSVHRVVTVPFQCVEQHEGLVKRQGADRVLQQKAQAVWRQTSQVGDSRPIRPKQGCRPEVIDPLTLEPIQHDLGYSSGVGAERVGIDAPVELGTTREAGHGVALDPNARDAELLALDQGRSSAAERIQYALCRVNSEHGEVIAYEVRRERENETVPVVNRAIFRLRRFRSGEGRAGPCETGVLTLRRRG